MPSKQVPRESKVPQVSRAIKTRGTRDTRSPLDTSSKNPQTMEELLAQTGYQVHGLKRDQQIEGTVTNVTSRTIFFDVGAKAEGIVVDREFEAAKDYIKALKIGDKVSLRVLYPENETGQVVLSLKGEALSSAWKHLLKAKDAGEEMRLKMAEKDKQMEQLRRSLEDARRKSEQGSMQIQGDVQEDDLKMLLRNNFSMDNIEDVPTGIKGADLV